MITIKKWKRHVRAIKALEELQTKRPDFYDAIFSGEPFVVIDVKDKCFVEVYNIARAELTEMGKWTPEWQKSYEKDVERWREIRRLK